MPCTACPHEAKPHLELNLVSHIRPELASKLCVKEPVDRREAGRPPWWHIAIDYLAILFFVAGEGWLPEKGHTSRSHGCIMHPPLRNRTKN
jgi:hypothetical protein